jgi:hypothetical protein
MDAAFIANCADPNLSPAIVEQFVAAAGSNDSLAVTVKSGGHLVLIPKPLSADDATDVARTYVGQAIVRVGITQFPAGLGVADASQLQPAMFDACENLRTGTGIFAKVARIVTKWYGRPTNQELLPQLLDDAIFAWKTGTFEGENVFRAEDPGGPTFFNKAGGEVIPAAETATPPSGEGGTQKRDEPADAAEAGMRVDLSRINGRK